MDRGVADVYSDLKAACRGNGVNLDALDMMIAAHALAANAILVTGDTSLSHVQSGLQVEDWTS